MKMRLANAPVSWGVDYADAPDSPPWSRVMGEIASAGFHWTELGPYGYYPADPALLRQQFEQRGLRVTGGFLFQPLHDPAALPRILDVATATCDLLKALGASHYVVIDHLSEEREQTAGRSDDARRLDASEWRHMLDAIRRVAAIARERGLTPVLHQHVGTHIEFQDEVDRILGDLDQEVIELCVDTGHMAYAGIDPVAIYRHYAGRVSFFHFKDINRAVHERVIREKIPFEAAVSQHIFCPLGKGVVDFVALRAALIENDFDGCATVEQDRDPTDPKSPLEDAKASLAFLQSIGFS